MNKVQAKQFADGWRKHRGVISSFAKHEGVTTRTIMTRRRDAERLLNVALVTADMSPRAKPNHMDRMVETIQNGHVVVFSDAHYWPGEPTLGHQALLRVIKKLKPAIVVANGDVFDAASINRHDPNGWEKKPTVAEELQVLRTRMGEIEKAAKGAKLHRTVGNHDMNFDRYLAMHASAYEEIGGFRLADHLPAWSECMSVWINGNVVVKHRWHNGVHAAYNNALKSGLTIVTGHLHRLIVTPWADYTGRRYGVDTGTIADPLGPQFRYTEDNPKPWCAGFAVLTFRDGKMLPPELVEVIDGHAYFRGEAV